MYLKVFPRVIGCGCVITFQVKNFRFDAFSIIHNAILILVTYSLSILCYIMQKVSERNKKNRAENDSHTTVGTKSLARVVEEKVEILLIRVLYS